MIREITNRLAEVYEREEAHAIACIIAEDATGLSMARILTLRLSLQDSPKAQAMLTRAMLGEPIQHITGYTMFCGNRIICDRRALIPRPETEELVEWILEKEQVDGLRVMDIGTGSGCIATALAKRWEVTAMEKSEEAIELASENFSANGVKVNLVKDDILAPALDYGIYDIIVSNPPYIRPSESQSMERNVLEYDPAMALFATDENPLLFYHAIAEFGRRHLNSGGRFYVEINRSLAENTAAVFRNAGYSEVEVARDMFGNERFISGIWTM